MHEFAPICLSFSFSLNKIRIVIGRHCAIHLKYKKANFLHWNYLNWTHKLHPFMSGERINTKELLPSGPSCFTRLRPNLCAILLFVFFVSPKLILRKFQCIYVQTCIVHNSAAGHHQETLTINKFDENHFPFSFYRYLSSNSPLFWYLI